MLIYTILAALMVIIDQAVKHWAAVTLRAIGTIPIIEGFFHLTYVENHGASFSILQGKQSFLIITSLIAFGVFVYMVKSGLVEGKLGYYALTFVAGGALGNFIDRVRLGYVVDLFDLRVINFPVFNVADLFITVGAILFILYAYKDFQKEKTKGETK